jgi:hypothetical protein
MRGLGRGCYARSAINRRKAAMVTYRAPLTTLAKLEHHCGGVWGYCSVTVLHCNTLFFKGIRTSNNGQRSSCPSWSHAGMMTPHGNIQEENQRMRTAYQETDTWRLIRFREASHHFELPTRFWVRDSAELFLLRHGRCTREGLGVDRQGFCSFSYLVKVRNHC